MRNCLVFPVLTAVVWTLVQLPTAAAPSEQALKSNLAIIQKLGPQGAGHADAIRAWQVIRQANPSQLPTLLASMDDTNPLANNWVRAAVDAIAEATLADGQNFPTALLEQYLAERSHSPRSRSLAFEWIRAADAQTADEWIPKFLDDPSLELRRVAVAHYLEQAKELKSQEQNVGAIELYQTALNHARAVDQIDQASESLRELGETVDLPTHFGFITTWQVIGPFDNRDKKGFDRVFPPEMNTDLDQQYAGKVDMVRWKEATTADPYGKVDLNDHLGKHMGAAGYALAYFESPTDRLVDLRLGCVNANKVWINGQEVISNHVYHSGRGIDQYVSQAELKQGRNTILVKICQNEQEDSWAQDWEFQLRVCDHLGTAVLSAP